MKVSKSSQKVSKLSKVKNCQECLNCQKFQKCQFMKITKIAPSASIVNHFWYFFYTTHILHIFAFDTNLQYFAFSYISIICSLYLHKFSYDSQIHNVLTCVNTLHFSEWNLLIFFLFDNLHDSEVGVYDTLCIPPVLESILPES